MKKKIKIDYKRILLINLSAILMTIGIYFFQMPNGFSTGGVSGLSIVLGKILTFTTPATIMLVINVLLLILAFFFVGKAFCFKTAYTSMFLSIGTFVLEKLVPISAPLTSQPCIELFVAILLTSVGSAILFNCSSSSGGTDIVAKILHKYTNINVGTCLLMNDSLIVFASFFVFGIETGIFSIVGLFVKSFLIDGVIENLNMCKYFTIITSKPDEICTFIINELKHGVTKEVAEGEYTKEARYVLLTVVKRSDAIKLRNYVKEVDPTSFIMITNTSEIIGKGFRNI